MEFNVGDEVILNNNIEDRWINAEVDGEGFVVEDVQKVSGVSLNGRIEISPVGYWLKTHNFALVLGEQNERL